MALSLLLAIFQWAVVTTHFPVRAHASVIDKHQGKGHIHFKEHQSGLPPNSFKFEGSWGPVTWPYGEKVLSSQLHTLDVVAGPAD